MFRMPRMAMKLDSEQTALTPSTGPRANAVRHGLTSDRLLPQILGENRLAQLLARFGDEFAPSTPTEDFLVRELARHAAGLELAERAEAAMLRAGVRAARDFPMCSGAPVIDEVDAALVGAISTDMLDRLTRYRRSQAPS